MNRRLDSLSTLELVHEAQAGSREAFEYLFGRYTYRLHSLIRLQVGHRLARSVGPEDIVQMTWEQAYKSLERFCWRGNESFFRWLAGIARNILRSEARRLPAKGALSLTSHRCLDLTYVSAGKALQREERFRRLMDALDRLSEDRREVIILSRVEGLSSREIAERTGRTPEAVRMLLLRTLRQLKTFFGSTDSLYLPSHRSDPSGDQESRHGE